MWTIRTQRYLPHTFPTRNPLLWRSVPVTIYSLSVVGLLGEYLRPVFILSASVTISERNATILGVHCWKQLVPVPPVVNC